MAVKTIIFDIGGVLVGYDWDAYMMQMFKDDRKLVDRIKNALFGHGVWNELDRGVWPKEKLIEAFCSYDPEISNEIVYFFENAGGALEIYPFTIEWLEELKGRGYQILFLSNWSSHVREANQECLKFLPLMDGGVFSYEVKLIKPDHAIYEKIIEQYELNPSEAVFLDDSIGNVIAARECGLYGVHVKTHDQAVAELEEILKL